MYRSTFSWLSRKWLVSFSALLLYTWGKSSQFASDRTLRRPWSRSEWYREEIILEPTGTQTPTPQSSSSRSTAVPTAIPRLRLILKRLLDSIFFTVHCKWRNAFNNMFPRRHSTYFPSTDIQFKESHFAAKERRTSLWIVTANVSSENSGSTPKWETCGFRKRERQVYSYKGGGTIHDVFMACDSCLELELRLQSRKGALGAEICFHKELINQISKYL
jgi:hypothetical protein